MLYQITDGTVSVGSAQILSHMNFEIRGSEKIAVVGRNGAGKTTLLRLIAGELSLDRDDKRQGPGIASSRKLTVGMLEQTTALWQEKTVEDILLESCPDWDDRERYAYETEYDRLFTGFGFDKKEKQRRLSSFSGGEQTKIALIRLLLMKPDILLLDEPTNHLDIPAVQWLEQYMKSYDRAVVIVSHDRFFLDQVADVVYELAQGQLKRYPGNYTQYRKQKQKALADGLKAYERQQKELARLDALVERFKHKPRKAAFARSRKTLIARMEKLPKPETDDVHIFTGDIEPLVPGSKWVLEAEHLEIGYTKPLAEFSLRIRKGQKIGIIGDNGVGKSTFLKTAAGKLLPLKGKCILGNRTVAGYFDQQSAMLASEKTVAEHFHDLFPAMTEKDVRQTLGAYLFGGKAASVKVNSLSGGEKARLVLAELLAARPNLLLLDEPTNHMDIQAKETLESAFQAYKGTILFVSHDRYFIQQVADAILVFDGQTVKYYPFGYSHYVEHQAKSRGGSMAAMVQAEEQALISGIRAVPKGERHQLRETDTEEAYRDWQLGLAAEPLFAAQKNAENAWQQWMAQKERLELLTWQQWAAQGEVPEHMRQWAAQGETSEDSKRAAQNKISPEKEENEAAQAGEKEIQLKKLLDEAWDLWTQSCLEWYHVWQQFEEE